MSTPSLPRLLIRADAGEKIGSGHAMRCLALAQAWQDAGGEVLHAGVLPPTLAIRFENERITRTALHDAPGSPADAVRTAALAAEVAAGWVVLDGYHFSLRYQQTLVATGARLLVHDDFGCLGAYAATVILDQNLGTSESAYAHREPESRLLLGPKFALLRREFSRWRGWTREIAAQGRRVLVTLGGSDPHNATLAALTALREVKVDDLEVVIVAGSGNPHHSQLAAAVREAGENFRLVIDARDLDELMAWADLAVAAGGSTSWERALLGLPGLIVVLAENQLPIAGALVTAGCARPLGWARDLRGPELTTGITAALRDAGWRATAAERSRELVDGRGAERVVNILAAISSEARCA